MLFRSQWSNQEVEDATWESYHSIAQRFPNFILEVENALKEGRLSRAETELGRNQPNFDSINTLVGEGVILGMEGRTIKTDEALQAGPKRQSEKRTVEGFINTHRDCVMGPKALEQETIQLETGEAMLDEAVVRLIETTQLIKTKLELRCQHAV